MSVSPIILILLGVVVALTVSQLLGAIIVLVGLALLLWPRLSRL